MKYYQDENGKVFAYEDDGSQDHLIPADYLRVNFQLPAPSIEDLIALTHQRINDAYENAVRAATSGYPKEEVRSWTKQEAEARAWTADNGTSTPLIDSICTVRGITRSELATKIIENADAFTVLYGGYTGKRQKLRDEIDALGGNPTQQQLDAVQW